MKKLSAVAKGIVTSAVIVSALTACGGGGNKIPEGTLFYCNTKTESFNVYPAGGPISGVTAGVPDGNFPIVVGRAPAGARVVLYEANHYGDANYATYGTVFAALSGPIPTPSNPLPPGVTTADLSQSTVPALKPNTTYSWTLSANPNSGCHASGTFTTQ